MALKDARLFSPLDATSTSLANFKSSLLLKRYLQRTQTLQVNLNWKEYKVIKTKQRTLALFRPRESNAEKRKLFNL
jgi:hypothetical protein